MTERQIGNDGTPYSRRIAAQRLLVTVLRLAIGWHFLYEGLFKIALGNWTAFGYLSNTSGPLSGFYHWLANTPSLLRITDVLNMAGLVLIGLALCAGLFVRLAAACGVLLLVLYYFAYPPFGNTLLNASEGHLFVVDRIFLEAAALLLILFSKERGYGLGALVRLLRKSGKGREVDAPDDAASARREALKHLASLPVLGAMG